MAPAYWIAEIFRFTFERRRRARPGTGKGPSAGKSEGPFFHGGVGDDTGSFRVRGRASPAFRCGSAFGEGTRAAACKKSRFPPKRRTARPLPRGTHVPGASGRQSEHSHRDFSVLALPLYRQRRRSGEIPSENIKKTACLTTRMTVHFMVPAEIQPASMYLTYPHRAGRVELPSDRLVGFEPFPCSALKRRSRPMQFSTSL